MNPNLIRRSINDEILRLSIPSILANITVPLVGLVDTAIAGHIAGAEASSYIGAISIGSMVFSLMYWGFTFLRTGTGGLTAQAFGRNDFDESSGILLRGICLSCAIALILLCIRRPFSAMAIKVTEASAQTEAFALSYFYIRVWSAPATLMLMTFKGWFIGMQDSFSSMWTDLIINIMNILASLVLTFGIGSCSTLGFSGWEGIGFPGIAAGTVISEYCGLLFCFAVCASKYRRLFARTLASDLASFKQLFAPSKLAEMFKLNADLFIRSLDFIVIYIGYTLIASRYGDLMLSASAVLMQIMMIFSYLTDGFAYAGEALTGRFIGSRNIALLRSSIRYVFIWSMGIALIFSIIYIFTSTPLLRLLTGGEELVQACRQFYPWLVLMPPLGCIAFTWDGIYQGATASGAIRNAMTISALLYFVIWIVFSRLLGVTPCTDPSTQGPVAMHILFAAYFAHLVWRGIHLSATYRKSILSRIIQQ